MTMSPENVFQLSLHSAAGDKCRISNVDVLTVGVDLAQTGSR